MPETRLAEPNELLPSTKFTVPVGIPIPDTELTGITWAWKVTGCPFADGLLFELSVVVVLSVPAIGVHCVGARAEVIISARERPRSVLDP